MVPTRVVVVEGGFRYETAVVVYVVYRWVQITESRISIVSFNSELNKYSTISFRTVQVLLSTTTRVIYITKVYTMSAVNTICYGLVLK